MKRTFTLMVLGGLLLALAGCAGKLGSGTTEARESRDMPKWSLERPAVEGIIYGVGQARKQNPSLAKKVAAQRARDEVAAAVKIKVESLVKDFMQESGVGERAEALEFTQAVSKGVTDATLTGCMIKETYIAKDGTYFVLVEYSLDEARRAAIESARKEEALLKKFTSKQGFDALQQRIEDRSDYPHVVSDLDIPITTRQGQETFLTSDVDNDIPEAARKRPYAVGVVIGITEYANPDVPNVDYAKRDALLVREYFIHTLGIQDENIIIALDQDATKATFHRIFEGQLQNYLRPGVSEVFVYYSGHGAPELKNSSAYFLPYDAHPNYAEQTGYSLEQFYRNLNNLEAASVTVVLDACFSGGSPAGMLIQKASPIFISVEHPAAILKNGTALTSSSGDQISSWYDAMGHGLFTYFFLKGLKGEADTNGDQKITVEEVYAYLKEHVPYRARRMYNREQTPQLFGHKINQVLVQY